MKITPTTRITNIRVASTSDSTMGILYADNEPIGFVVEDEYREIKVKGETRIPAGTYKLGIRKVLSPLTQKYRDRYSWFKYHIELLNVENFTNILIHIGNTEKDTMGCQVVGTSSVIYNGEYGVGKSTLFFKELYQKLYPLLENGATIYYTIIDKDDF